MQYTPVKEKAMLYGIPVYQPKRVRDPECVEELRKYHADVIVVIAFGQILPKSILELTPYGCINVHASLLPKYRGAAPIQWAIIEGESVTGVTTMQMDEGLDTGDMIMKTEIPIAADETGEHWLCKLKKEFLYGAMMKTCVNLMQKFQCIIMVLSRMMILELKTPAVSLTTKRLYRPAACTGNYSEVVPLFSIKEKLSLCKGTVNFTKA